MFRAGLALTVMLLLASVSAKADSLMGYDEFVLNGVSVNPTNATPDSGLITAITFTGISNSFSTGTLGVPSDASVIGTYLGANTFSISSAAKFDLTFGYPSPYYGTFVNGVSSPDAPILLDQGTADTGSYADYLLYGTYFSSSNAAYGADLFIHLTETSGVYSATGDMYVTPEPSSLALLCTGLFGIADAVRRQTIKRAERTE